MNFIVGPIDIYSSIIGSCSTNMHHTTGACVPARIGDVFDSSNRWRGGWCACKYFSWCGTGASVGTLVGDFVVTGCLVGEGVFFLRVRP